MINSCLLLACLLPIPYSRLPKIQNFPLYPIEKYCKIIVVNILHHYN
ncbi:hypothetical protein [Moorena sp. SIO3I6]|nr:hypothetical protein [Moorena sp. SIO3I6]